MGRLWAAGGALALAALLVALHPSTPARRLSNLELGASQLPNTYIVAPEWDPDRVLVVQRGGSTLRRDDARLRGGKWRFLRAGAGTESDTWMVQSKRPGRGTIFFVPVTLVPDWSYPMLYAFVRGSEGVELPEVGWTQLFVNRVYRGLYLRVALPFDPRKRDGGSGVLRQVVAVEGDRITPFDTRFETDRELLVASLEGGGLPPVSPPPPALAWLGRRAPTAETTLLMSNEPPYALSLLPLPVSLPGLFERLAGRVPASFEDPRYGRWSAAAAGVEGDGDAELPFDEADLAELRAFFQVYGEAFRAGLLAHGELHQTLPALREELPRRQAALRGLPLRLPEI